MKFTKEDACKDLMSKIPTKGETLQLSERSINEQLETLMPLLANDETELDAFVTSVLPIFKTADANIRANVSAQVKDYKEKNPITPPKKEGEKEKEGEKKDDKYEALLARVEAMETAHKEEETKKKVKSLREEFIAKAKEKGVKNESWLKDYAEEITIGEDFNVEAKADSCLKFYNKFKSKMNTDVSPEDGGGDNLDASKYLKEVIKRAGEKAKNEGLNG